MSEKKLFMEPGKTNQEDRANFVRYWVNYIKEHSDEDWGSQLALLIDSQFKSADHESYLRRMNIKK